MKGGYVGKIRVPPQDVMACIDLVHKSGLVTQGMSLAMVIRLALSGFCAGARKAGMVPQRDGFEYNQMTSSFIHSAQTRKLMVSEQLDQDSAFRQAHDMVVKANPMAEAIFNDAPVVCDKVALTDQERQRLQYLAAERAPGPKAWDEANPGLAKEFYALEDRV